MRGQCVSVFTTLTALKKVHDDADDRKSSGGPRLFCTVLRLRPILLPFFRGKGPLIRVLFTSFVLQELDPWMPIMKGHEAQL